MLELVDIHKEFDGKKVLDGISLSVAAGECVCLTGASGCGKTTLLRIAAGLETADSGVRNINAKTKIAVLFQEDRLLPWDTALSNITAVGVDADRARYFLKRVGLENEADSYPDELSGGMKRRLSLARMLAYGGDLYLFDEALTGLDEALQKDMLDLIKEEICGKAAIIVSHNPTVPQYLGARPAKLGFASR